MNPQDEGILYFDCFSGISGDMAVAALLDLGVDAGELRRELAKLALPGYEVEIRSGARKGIRCAEFIVHSRGEEHPHRRLDDILAIIGRSGLAAPVQDLSRRIFTVLAAAEAAVHGREIGEIHFHEVGAVDSIVDIVGFAVCLTALQPARIMASPVNLGSGLVRLRPRSPARAGAGGGGTCPRHPGICLRNTPPGTDHPHRHGDPQGRLRGIWPPAGDGGRTGRIWGRAGGP